MMSRGTGDPTQKSQARGYSARDLVALERAHVDAQISLAMEIAVAAHQGQLDEDGSEHLDHVRAVVALAPEGAAKAVAWLHDVIEDTSLTRDELVARGVDPEIADAVQIISRDPEIETYWQFIERIVASENPLALAGKLPDNEANLRRSRGQSLERRYERARALLAPACKAHGISLSSG